MNDRNNTNTPAQPAIGDERADAWLVLALSQQTPAGRHPEDDTLSAWHERRLDAAAAQQVELHVSQCDQCFATWNGLLALAPVPENATVRTGFGSRVAGALRDLLGTRSGVRRLGAVAAAMFAAVALSVLVFDGSQPLPGYSISLEGNTKYVRGGGAATETAVVFETGNRFQLVLTPDTAYIDDVEAALYVIGADSNLSRLPAPGAEAAGNGALRIAGDVGKGIVLPAGATQLLVVVGQRGRLPDGAEVVSELGSASTAAAARWQAWRIPIEVVVGAIEQDY